MTVSLFFDCSHSLPADDFKDVAVFVVMEFLDVDTAAELAGGTEFRMVGYVESVEAEGGVVEEEEPVVAVFDDAVVIGSAAYRGEDSALVGVRAERGVGYGVDDFRLVAGERAVGV